MERSPIGKSTASIRAEFRGEDERLFAVFGTEMCIRDRYQAARLDIEQTKNKKTREEKEREFSDWENDNCSEFILRDKEALVNEIHRIQRYATPVWQKLVALEASQFMPYQSKKLKYDAATLDMVCSDLPGFEDKECTKYRKAVIKETSAIKGVKKAVLAGCVGIGVVAVATGGAAYVFAPAIAPILACLLYTSSEIMGALVAKLLVCAV